MLAEYRRIIKNPTPERKKKCIFFESIHRIYQAKDAKAIENAILNYESGDILNNDNSNADNNGDLEEKNDFFYIMPPISYDFSVPINNEDGKTNFYHVCNI